MINFKARLRHKPFLVALASGVWLLIQQVAALFGHDITVYSAQVTDISNTILFILTITGIVIDPLTEGVTDSKRALMYKEPKKKGSMY